MVKTLKGFKRVVWGYVVDDPPKIRNHLKLYLEFHILDKHVRKYLSRWHQERDTKKVYNFRGGQGSYKFYYIRHLRTIGCEKISL